MRQGWISTDFMVKSNSKKNTQVIGYASVFGITDNHNDIIIKGAFKKSITGYVKFLWQHDVTKPIGIITSIEEDEYGLRIEAEINNNTVMGQEASELIKQRAVCGLSIGFVIKNYDYSKDGIRVINELDLKEISVVTFPANEHAEIHYVKSDSTHQAWTNQSLHELSELIKQLDPK